MEKELLKTLLRMRVSVLFRQIPPVRAKDRTGEVKTFSVSGTYDWEHTIVLDLRKNTNPARNFLHELLHRYLGQDVSETEVIRQERKLWRSMTQYERWLTYRILFGRDWKDEP